MRLQHFPSLLYPGVTTAPGNLSYKTDHDTILFAGLQGKEVSACEGSDWSGHLVTRRGVPSSAARVSCDDNDDF